jgi:hypothetical protein
LGENIYITDYKELMFIIYKENIFGGTWDWTQRLRLAIKHSTTWATCLALFALVCI